VSFYVSTAIYFLLHCDEWGHFVAPPRHKFVTGATLLQLAGSQIFLCLLWGWLLFNANSAIFSAISWREQVNFQWDDDYDEVRFVPDQAAELDFYNASSLKQQSAGRHVAPLGHIILIPSQPVFALSP
jgi:hypothetical protein